MILLDFRTRANYVRMLPAVKKTNKVDLAFCLECCLEPYINIVPGGAYIFSCN